MRVTARLLLLLSAVLGAAAAPAFGHVTSELDVPSAAGGPSVVTAVSSAVFSEAISADGAPAGGLILAVVAFVVAVCTFRRRRSAATALALFLALAACEMAFHAAHHTGDAAAAAKCPGAQAAAHLAEADIGGLADTPTVALVRALAAHDAPVVAPARLAASVGPRAPPRPIS